MSACILTDVAVLKCPSRIATRYNNGPDSPVVPTFYTVGASCTLDRRKVIWTRRLRTIEGAPHRVNAVEARFVNVGGPGGWWVLTQRRDAKPDGQEMGRRYASSVGPCTGRRVFGRGQSTPPVRRPDRRSTRRAASILLFRGGRTYDGERVTCRSTTRCLYRPVGRAIRGSRTHAPGRLDNAGCWLHFNTAVYRAESVIRRTTSDASCVGVQWQGHERSLSDRSKASTSADRSGPNDFTSVDGQFVPWGARPTCPKGYTQVSGCSQVANRGDYRCQ